MLSPCRKLHSHGTLPRHGWIEDLIQVPPFPGSPGLDVTQYSGALGTVPSPLPYLPARKNAGVADDARQVNGGARTARPVDAAVPGTACHAAVVVVATAGHDKVSDGA